MGGWEGVATYLQGGVARQAPMINIPEKWQFLQFEFDLPRVQLYSVDRSERHSSHVFCQIPDFQHNQVD